VKLNVVVVRGVNDGELAALARFGWRHGAIVRFIELMPFGRGEPVPLVECGGCSPPGLRLEPDTTALGPPPTCAASATGRRPRAGCSASSAP